MISEHYISIGDTLSFLHLHVTSAVHVSLCFILFVFLFFLLLFICCCFFCCCCFFVFVFFFFGGGGLSVC